LYKTILKQHYTSVWGIRFTLSIWNHIDVLIFPPHAKRNFWTYATAGISSFSDETPVELHLFSPFENQRFVELLGIIGHYQKQLNLNLGHTVNIGEPWYDGSSCNFGLISLPYLDGSDIENCVVNDKICKCYWLIPVTEQEVAYKKLAGFEALEERLELAQFNYLDFSRNSVI
jgi:hypothetical protein